MTEVNVGNVIVLKMKQMCRKKQFKYCPSEIDECMKPILEHIHGNVIACCCGHGKYPMTIVKKMGFQNDPYFLEIISGKIIPRKKKFYKKDKKGYYYIPETIKQDSFKN